ncbi:hypothetical protein L227DRAFT_577811, partial [Lentinus tigrinus ALCF2SS1-6]
MPFPPPTNHSPLQLASPSQWILRRQNHVYIRREWLTWCHQPCNERTRNSSPTCNYLEEEDSLAGAGEHAQWLNRADCFTPVYLFRYLSASEYLSLFYSPGLSGDAIEPLKEAGGSKNLGQLARLSPDNIAAQWSIHRHLPKHPRSRSGTKDAIPNQHNTSPRPLTAQLLRRIVGRWPAVPTGLSKEVGCYAALAM